ncbi:MAG: hypothetical protein HY273_07630 [Gammaproteobacteria bacterium]|nr:hypothetical protein [Gammaproteobacteria bacterium]
MEINNWPGQGRGNCVDIVVQMITSEGEKFTVVIESKGCWNKELHSQMETQLKQQYLAGAGHRCGVYLVGWFGTEHCKANRQSLKVLKRKLKTQAKKLSHEGVTLRVFVLDGTLPLARKTLKSVKKQ